MSKKNPRLHVSKNPKLHISNPTLKLGTVEYPSFGKETATLGKKTIHGHKQEFPSLLPKDGERGGHGLGKGPAAHNKPARHFPRLLAK